MPSNENDYAEIDEYGIRWEFKAVNSYNEKQERLTALLRDDDLLRSTILNLVKSGKLEARLRKRLSRGVTSTGRELFFNGYAARILKQNGFGTPVGGGRLRISGNRQVLIILRECLLPIKPSTT